ncbi:MAG: hypothetical protein LBI86_09530 [Treponema sp.]|jgi:sedoheptulokinase|nr:hypothetical protein [Treponema sp.]
MKALAFDIGTTKICSLVFDAENGRTLEVLHGANTFVPSVRPWERIQDPEAVFRIVEGMYLTMMKKHAPIGGIGISCQMHGILYVDSEGRALSPFYTWQDGSGALPFRDGKTYTEYLSGLAAKTFRGNSPAVPYTPAAGYGLVTHFYHRSAGTVPAGTSKLCTIGDYIAMRLCGAARPVMHATNACALGFFDPRSSCFDIETLEAAGIDTALLPRAAGDFAPAGEIRGTCGNGSVPVAAAVGDNQAGFLGSVRGADKGALVNMGTGGQISLIGGTDGNSGGEKYPDEQSPLERRPYFEGKFLCSGASLCGGKAYAMLEEFFRAVLRMAGVPNAVPLYGAMEDALRKDEDTQSPEEPLLVNTMFEGSRRDPLPRGWIKNISSANFTPAALIRGFLEGMAEELYGMLPEGRRGEASAASPMEKITFLAGSGNGIRRNAFLRRVIEKKFALPLMIPLHEEEAAFGAALYALICAGRFRGTAEAARLIRYQGETP